MSITVRVGRSSRNLEIIKINGNNLEKSSANLLPPPPPLYSGMMLFGLTNENIKRSLSMVVPDGEGLVSEEPVLQLHEVGHRRIEVDELGPVEVDLDVEDAINAHKQISLTQKLEL